MNELDGWIVIPRWQRFQHFGAAWRQNYIKVHTAWLGLDAYVDLTAEARGVMHGLWLAYATFDGHLQVAELPAILNLPADVVDRGVRALARAELIDWPHRDKPQSITELEAIALDNVRERRGR